MRLSEAYAVCRDIARREARNFYYAFLVLPEEKRNAICAVYAFMRHADDLSDDESRPAVDRRRDLDAWVGAWHRADAGGETNDPVFLALRDTRQRFRIRPELLDQLVEGTTNDLKRAASQPARFDTYQTFDELYRYCYLVASVVGLVCIRIFGYTDPRAERLAEETGIAFQLTNILRDVREDAERGRIYLPLDDLAKYEVTPESLAQVDGGAPVASQRELLSSIASRARGYYASSQALLPLIDADSRPALRVLVTIYRRLLDRIERSGYNVFSEKIRVPTREKLLIMFGGILGVARARLTVRA